MVDVAGPLILVEPKGRLGNVVIEEGARKRVFFVELGMGQGTLSFGKKYPYPYLNF
jgi:hypothetical protein